MTSGKRPWLWAGLILILGGVWIFNHPFNPTTVTAPVTAKATAVPQIATRAYGPPHQMKVVLPASETHPERWVPVGSNTTCVVQGVAVNSKELAVSVTHGYSNKLVWYTLDATAQQLGTSIYTGTPLPPTFFDEVSGYQAQVQNNSVVLSKGEKILQTYSCAELVGDTAIDETQMELLVMSLGLPPGQSAFCGELEEKYGHPICTGK